MRVIYRIIPLILIANIITACAPETDTSDKKAEAPVQVTEDPREQDTLIYIFENSVLLKELRVKEIGEEKIWYHARIKSKLPACTANYTGIANCGSCNHDPEIDEDEDGNAYPADEYWHHAGHYNIRIRLGFDAPKAKFSLGNPSERCVKYDMDVVLSRLAE